MLKVENLRKSFGGVVATSDVSIDFVAGSLSAVIGPNGAGKTTFFNLISGGLQPDSGRILLDGEDIVGLPSSEIVRKGIGRAFQVAKLFKSLTVEESLRGALQSPLGQSLQMRAGDHQAQQPLMVAVMERKGSRGVAFDVEGSGYGFRVVHQLSAEAASQAHSCRMARP